MSARRAHPGFTRASFVVGDANRVAAHAADAVTAQPGTRYNPLVIVGGSGVGKTHLAHAIAHAMAHSHGAQVRCVHACTLADELQSAITAGHAHARTEAYAAPDLLVVDDLHGLLVREPARELLEGLFAALLDAGRQVVVTSTVAPAACGHLPEGLRARLAGGLTVEIGPPDRALRSAVAAQVFTALGERVDAGVVAIVAERSVSSVRAVASDVHRIVAEATGRGVPLDATFVRGLQGLDPVHVVVEWPDLAGSLLEEFR